MHHSTVLARNKGQSVCPDKRFGETRRNTYRCHHIMLHHPRLVSERKLALELDRIAHQALRRELATLGAQHEERHSDRENHEEIWATNKTKNAYNLRVKS